MTVFFKICGTILVRREGGLLEELNFFVKSLDQVVRAWRDPNGTQCYQKWEGGKVIGGSQMCKAVATMSLTQGCAVNLNQLFYSKIMYKIM